MDVDSLSTTLAEILEPRRVLLGTEIPPRYKLDGLRPHRASDLPEGGIRPVAVVFPRSTREVSSVLRLANELGLSALARGGGTGLMGGARPQSDTIVIDLGRMHRVRAIDPRSGTATAEAGIVLEELDRRLRAKGLMLGHDPWSQPRATLGGAIATNGLGYTGFVYGTMGDQVLGLEAVLPDGVIVRTRPAVRATTGFDLKRLFIGTEGSLGLVTAATIRAFPVPQCQEIHAFEFRDFERGLASLERIYDDGLTPMVMDFGETYHAPGAPWRSEAGPPTLFLGFAGASEVVRASWRRARLRLKARGARPLPEGEARAYWRSRHDIIFRTDEIAPGLSEADRFLESTIFDYVHVTLPREKILPYRRGALAALRRHGVQATSFGVWTQLELVSLEMVRPVGRDRAAAKAAVAGAIDAVLRRAQALGGSMEYVHGIGLKLAHLMEEELGPGLRVLERMKGAMDPRAVLNPGKGGL